MCLRSKNRLICASNQDLHKGHQDARNNTDVSNQLKRGKQNVTLRNKNIDEIAKVQNKKENPRYTLRSNQGTSRKKIHLQRLENTIDTQLYPLVENIQIADQNKCVKEIQREKITTEINDGNISQSLLISTGQCKMKSIQISEIPSELQGHDEKRAEEMYRIDIIEESQFDFSINLASNNKNKSCLEHCETGYNAHDTNHIERWNTSTPKRGNKQHNISIAKLMEYVPPITRHELFHSNENFLKVKDLTSPHKRKSHVEVGVLRESVLAYGSRAEEDIGEVLQGEFDSINDNTVGGIRAKVHRSEISNSWSPLSSTNYEENTIRFLGNFPTYIPNRREYEKEEMEFMTKYEFRPHISNKMSHIWASSYVIKNNQL